MSLGPAVKESSGSSVPRPGCAAALGITDDDSDSARKNCSPAITLSAKLEEKRFLGAFRLRSNTSANNRHYCRIAIADPLSEWVDRYGEKLGPADQASAC